MEGEVEPEEHKEEEVQWRSSETRRSPRAGGGREEGLRVTGEDKAEHHLRKKNEEEEDKHKMSDKVGLIATTITFYSFICLFTSTATVTNICIFATSVRSRKD